MARCSGKKLAADWVGVEAVPATAAGDFMRPCGFQLRDAVDAFFDKVMVMADDANLRTARLQLLAQIRREFREIADISKLQG
jgi:glycyl-tRNA synthetase beta chain